MVIHALVKNDIKPSLTSYFFKKYSLYFALIEITFFILISLKVVNIAALFCASLSLWAILCLILLKGLITSVVLFKELSFLSIKFVHSNFLPGIFVFTT